jgi:hypothetical protein
MRVFIVEFTEPEPKPGLDRPDFPTPDAFEEALVEALEFAGGPLMDYAVSVTAIAERRRRRQA